jgi:dCMP deaminase
LGQNTGDNLKEVISSGLRKINAMIRPTFNELFLLQAKLAASRSTCNSRPQGAVLVRDNRIIATGYNGALAGQEHCSDHKKVKCPWCGGRIVHKIVGSYNCSYCNNIGQIPYCRRRATQIPDFQKDRACVSAHAEANAVAQAARMGVATEGAMLYCTTRPCAVCIKMLVMAGIKRVFYELDYDDQDDQWLLDLLPMEQLIIRQEVIALAQATLNPETSRRRLGRTE